MCHGARRLAVWRNIRRIWLPVLTFFFAASWAFEVPVGSPAFENYFPDEGNHLKVVRFIAAEHSLPPYSFAYYEVAHPPLYHLAMAIVSAIVMPVLGNVHGPLLLRLINALSGAALTYLVGAGVARVSTPRVAALAAGLAGLLPGRIAVSAGVSNENLVALAGVGAFAALASQLRNPTRGEINLSIWVALAVGAKVTGLGY